MYRSISTRLVILFAACFTLSAMAQEDAVNPANTLELCQLVKENKAQEFISKLQSEDIRLYTSYRSITCPTTLGFKGGSLLKTADHYAATEVFNKLVQSIKVDDIFWEARPAADIKNTRIIAYKN
ncbi:MAG: hypothetical protein HWE27_02630 [Gammaproteobacteria bacterium]|nr:hypothetical protein [Gammaproteobacteria bacterium]